MGTLIMHLLIAFLLTIPAAAFACGCEIGFLQHYISEKPHKRQEILKGEEKKCFGSSIILGAMVVYRLIKGTDVLIMFVVAMVLLGMYMGVVLCKRNEWFSN